mgnify:FL=1
MISIIVAIARNGVIGNGNALIWRIAEDLRRFKALTTGHPVIMGRKTLDSFPGGRPLPKRRNIVITRSPDFHREGCEIVHTPEDALRLAGDGEDVWLIGGGSIYTALLGRCRRACVTRVDAAAENADTFFPNLDTLPEWTVERTEAPVTENGLAYRFVDYVNTAL